jgi:NADPH:quinone reductase
MKTVVVTTAGGPDVLELVDRPDPVPGSGEVVVRMAAANVNPTDLAARQGMVARGLTIDGPPYVLGWDLAGEVVGVGGGVDGLDVGDRVVGMIPWYAAGGRYGAYAELVLVQADWLVDLPSGLDPVAAATIPLNALTAQQALDKLEMPAGASLLVTGACSAVGSFAVQLAVAHGVRVTGIAGTDDEEWVASLGVERVLPRDTDLAGVGTFKFVLDAVPLGAPVFGAVADGGAIAATRPVDADPGRGITQHRVLIRADREALRELVGRVASGSLRTRVAQTVPLSQAPEAHRLSERRGRQGKIVLVPG